jgi:hypothetical protein
VVYEGLLYRLQHEPLKQADGRFCVMVLEKLDQILAGVFETNVFEAGVFA